MNLKPHSFSTGLLAIVVTFLFMFLSSIFYKYVIYDHFTPNNRDKYKAVKPFENEKESYSKIYPVSFENNSVIEFYNNELRDYMKEFINANERYDIFKTRVQYGLALACINSEFKEHQIDWHGKTENYRKNARNSYANTAQKIQQFKDNESFLFKNEKVFDFDLIKNVETALLYPITPDTKSFCKKKTPIADIYPQFIIYYLKRYHTGNRSREWYRSLEQYHPYFFIQKNKHIIEREKPFKRKTESKKMQELRAKRDEEYFIKLKEKLSSPENSESIDNLLFYAVKEQNIKSVALLLEKNANMYTMDRAKLYTAFSYACFSNPLKPHENKVDLVKLFLKNNVDVNYQYNKSETALTQASKGCHNLQLVKLLLDNGANPDIQDKFGFTTRNGLFRSCRDKKKYKKMMELINEY